MVQTKLPPPGASHFPQALPFQRERHFIKWIDAQPWLANMKRRVQHYGWRYDYRARTVSPDDDLGTLPDRLIELLTLPALQTAFGSPPDQVIINEYWPGQGISAHVDCEPCFGPVIASLSLGGAVDMVFRHPEGDQSGTIRLEPCSLLILTGPARYDWTHEIPARKSDVVNGVRITRDRRISLTFRNVIRS